MTEFLGAVSGGIGLGAVYTLLALGFVIIYKSMQVISFAQPAFMFAGALLVTYLAPQVGFLLAVVVAAVGIAVLGGVLAGAFGGWRAARLSPAAALCSVA